MAEINYKELSNYLKDRETGDFAAVYLIYGEELLYKNSLEALLDALMPGTKGALTMSRLTVQMIKLKMQSSG